MSGRRLRFSERVYKALLAAYPRGFRDAYGQQMERTFGDLCRKERRGRATGLMRLGARTIVDLGSTAVVERIDERKLARNREAKMNERGLAWVGLALLLAPLFFVAASLLKYELGIGFLFDPLEALLADPGRQHSGNLGSPVVF